MPRINVAERNQQKIATFYERKEEARQKLATRTDVVDTYHRRLRKGSLQLHKRELRLFETFMKTVMQIDPEPYMTRSDNSKAPDATLLKRYCLFRAQNGVGKVASKFSVWKVIGELATLTSALRRAIFLPTSNTTRKDVLYYVKDHLTTDMVAADERLSSERKIKPAATTADVEILLETLFTSATFENLMLFSRDVLQLSLFICLMVDCCGRGCDVSFNNKHAESLDECLRWKDLALYVKNTPTGPLIFGGLTLHWMKGTAWDPSKYKTIPFTLLPSHMAHCDALRQLLVLGIMDCILPAWRTIEKSMPDTPSSTFRITIPEGKADLPIFRYTDPITKRVTAKPRGRSWFGKYLKILGETAGFELPVTGYNLRRGSAHLLDLQCTPSMRKFMMGHVDQSHLFHSTYQSRIAAIDVGAVFWSAPETSQAQLDYMIEIGKDRVVGAPLRISSAGERACQMSQEYIALTEDVDKIYKKLRAKFDSIPAARKAGKGDWTEANDFDQARSQQRAALSRLRRTKLSEERELFRTTQYKLPHEVPDDSSHAAGTEIPTEDVDATLDTIFVDPWSDMSDNTSLLTAPARHEPGDTTAWEAINIEEPSDLGMDDTEFILLDIIDSGILRAEEMEGIDAVDSCPLAINPVLLQSSVNADLTDREKSESRSTPWQATGTERCHGLLPRQGDAIANEALLALRSRHTIYNLLTSGSICDAELSDEMVMHFSRLHTDFHFPKAYQPVPGTYDCIYCSLDLSGIRDDTSWEHVHRCASKHYANEYSAFVENTMPASQVCSWAMCKGHNLATKTQAEKIRHHTKHGQRWHNNNAENKYPCFYGQCSNTVFDHRAAWVLHVATEHNHIVECFGSQFCTLCEEWYVGGGGYETHLEGHLNDVLDIVKKVGYNGLLLRERVIVPKACPFCLHDTSLPIEADLLMKRKIQIGSAPMENHIASHLQAQGDGNRRCPCFNVAFCNNGDFMTAAEIKIHLEEAHNLLPAITFKNGFKRVKNDDAAQLGPKKLSRAGSKIAIDPSNYPGTIHYGDDRCDHCIEKDISQCRVPTRSVQGQAGKQMTADGVVDLRRGGRSCEGCSAHRTKCSLLVVKSASKDRNDAVYLGKNV